LNLKGKFTQGIIRKAQENKRKTGVKSPISSVYSPKKRKFPLNKANSSQRQDKKVGTENAMYISEGCK